MSNPTKIHPEEKPTMQPKILAALGLSDVATEAAVVARLEALASKAALADAAQAAAKKSAAEVETLKATGEKMAARVSALEASTRRAEILKLLDQASREGRLTPARRRELLVRCGIGDELPESERVEIEATFQAAGVSMTPLLFADVAALKFDLARLPVLAPPILRPPGSGSPRSEAWEAFTVAERTEMQRKEPERFTALLEDFRRRTGGALKDV